MSPFGEAEPPAAAAQPIEAVAPSSSLKAEDSGYDNIIPTSYLARINRDGKLEVSPHARAISGDAGAAASANI